MANDEGETLDFGEMGMLGDLPGGPPADEGLAPEDDAAPLVEPGDEEEEEQEDEEKPTLLEKLRETSPYTVMLGLALLAVVIAVVILAMEWSSYNWDTGAKEYKGAMAAPAAQSALPSTTAAA